MLHSEASGDGPPVVLVHGFTQTRRSWDPLLHRFSAAHRVIVVDAPGHGRSGNLTGDLWQGAQWLGEAGGRGAYVGYSMGGRLALHLALLRPELVTRLVLVGATAGLDTDEERRERRAADEQLAQGLERDGLEAFLERWLAGPLFATLSPEAAGRADRLENTVEGLATSLRLTGTGTQESLWSRLDELTMPVLLVAGERDEKFTALAHRMAEAWGGPASVRIIPDAGHACHAERPEAFVDLVLAFLDDDHAAAMPADSSSP